MKGKRSYIRIETNDKELVAYYSSCWRDGLCINEREYTAINFDFDVDDKLIIIACPTDEFNKGEVL